MESNAALDSSCKSSLPAKEYWSALAGLSERISNSKSEGLLPWWQRRVMKKIGKPWASELIPVRLRSLHFSSTEEVDWHLYDGSESAHESVHLR